MLRANRINRSVVNFDDFSSLRSLSEDCSTHENVLLEETEKRDFVHSALAIDS